jgi:thiol-disulfide isomerase/thioredoxin
MCPFKSDCSPQRKQGVPAGWAILSWFCFAVAAIAGEPAVLHLTDDGFLPGQVEASADVNVLRWRSPLFAQPFDFPLASVSAVHYPLPGNRPKPVGEYCFELAGDDVIYGNLLGLTDDTVEIDAARIGHVHLRRASIGRFYPCQGVDTLYQGPDGLAGWRDPATTSPWHDEGGQLATDKPGATLIGDFGIPARAIIEFEVSWKHRPDFVFALGVNSKEDTVQHAFRFEVWDNDLVAVGEADRDADVIPIEELGPGEGHVRLQVYLDQEQGRLLMFSRNGKPLGTLNISAKKRQVLPAVRLTNHKGDIRLELLRITRWNDNRPRQAWKDEPRVQRTDGTVIYGQLSAYDPKLKQFSVRDGKTETTVKQEAVADIFFSSSQRPQANKTDPTKNERMLRVVYHDGTRFSGKLTRTEDKHVSLNCPDVVEPLRLPLAEVRSLIGLRSGGSPAPSTVDGRAGRLEMDGVRLKGRLVAGSEQPNASCLVWRPDAAANASPVVHGASGRVVYREAPPPPPKAPPVTRQMQRVVAGQRGGVIQRKTTTVNTSSPTPTGQRALHLRSGDTIPCEVSRIDDKGVTFKTPLSDATFVAHEKIKSVELIPATAPRLAKIKRERLLTLPRLQKDSPPTHLICSTNGDILRGRILDMDDKVLHVELRLETKEVPRERVAQIIWLHADELADTNPTTPAKHEATKVTRVQTLRAPENRLTFVAQKLDNGILSGTSEILGPCKAQLTEVDELLFGAFIDQSASQLAYQRWKLHNAIEPKFAQDSAAAPERVTGTESPLVGKPAFAFKLDMLDGKQFQLAGHKGRVVVLDFWATWCGPCMQTMPLIDGVVREFAGQPVDLVAVNLEEQPDQIKSMLERYKLKVPVALDHDGAVSARYGVTAIPQTVVVDREGKVARLFVGGGQGTADALRKALQELSAAKPAPPATQ